MNLTDRLTELIGSSPRMTELESKYNALSATCDNILQDIADSSKEYGQYKDEMAEIVATLKAELYKQGEVIGILKTEHISLVTIMQAMSENQNILQGNIKQLSETIESLK